jgi:hypothetical protein
MLAGAAMPQGRMCRFHAAMSLSSSRSRRLPVLAKAAGSGGPIPKRYEANGIGGSEFLSMDVQQVSQLLMETQKSMLALNSSRVKMAEALSQAQRRIAELGEESPCTWL